MIKLFATLSALKHTAMSRRNEEGATAVEYALLVALIAIVIIVGVGLFGGWLNDFFGGIEEEITGELGETDPE